MSFANLKRNSVDKFKQLAEKMNSENKGASFTDDRFWQPDIDKSGSGFAIIRFLPAIESEEIPYVKMYSHGIKIGQKWFIENCATTIGQPCPVCESNSELWNTGTKENQDIVRSRKRQLKYISNIMVLQDAKRPQNEGKVFLFTFGAKIFAKLMNAINPEFEDEQSFNPFDFWGGAPFKLKIRNVEGYRNYDKSEFGECGPLFNDDSAMEEVWKSQYSLQELIAPSVFKPYDEIKKKFIAFISAPVVNAEVESNMKEQKSRLEAGSTKTSGSFEKASNKTADDPVTRVVHPTTTESDDDDFALFQSLIDD